MADELIAGIRGALSWIEPPFITAETSADELRSRIGFCLADAERAIEQHTRIEPEAADRGWQPIKIAPRGPHLLGFDPRWGVCEILRSSQMADWHVAAFNGQIIKCSPTHWRLLPDPPAIQSSEQEGGHD